MKRILAGSILLTISYTSLAALETRKDWDKSPEFVYLATDDERKEWKKIANDADAEKFIALFWARRDPDLKTPENEFRDRFEALVKKADEVFPIGKKRGALTERGRAFVLIGAPKSIGQRPDSSLDSGFAGTVSRSSTGAGGVSGTGGGSSIIYQFLYEQSQLPAWSDVHTLELKFRVDTGTETESLIDMAGARRFEDKAVKMALVHPELKVAPVYKTREQVASEQKVASAEAAETQRGPALTPAVRQALESALAKPPFGSLTSVGFAYRDGSTRLMTQLFVPVAAISAPEGARLAVLVRDKAGKDAARLEEPAALKKTKGDFFLDRVIRVDAGDYDIAAAVVDGAGAVLASAHRAVTVAPLPTEFAASSLFLATNDFPADSPKPEDPFTFSGRKFVGRGDGHVEMGDGLSYAVRVYNPAVDPTSKTILIKRAIRVKPKSGAALEVPQPPEEPAPAGDKGGQGPFILDLAGNLVESNLGQYFKAGDYELRITLTDTVANKKVEVVAPFTVMPAPKK